MKDVEKLPELIAEFIAAQNEHNSSAYVKNFAEDAIVHDEGKNYHGKSEIKRWNESTNEKYHTR